MAEDETFRFLTKAVFELLPQEEKLAYLGAATQALQGKGHGWGSVFADEDPGNTPPDPVPRPEDGRE